MLIAEYPPFRPLTGMKSPHLQTVGAFFLRGKRIKYRAVKYSVNLWDGDQLVIHDDQPVEWITGDRIAILFHGLCGCHGSPYMVRLTDKLKKHGIRVIRVDMRGFGDSKLVSKSHLHGGNYRDVVSVINFVRQLSPISKISLVGFSVGGNIILRTIGMWGDQHPIEVDSAIAVSPPVDLLMCATNIRQFGNRIYEKYFMTRMNAHLSERRRKVKGLVDSGVSPLPDRLIHFDDRFTAPCWGYSGVLDYYADAMAGPVLDQVAIPTIILTAEDDPIVPFEMYSNFPMSNFIEMAVTRHGGHLGFLANSRDPDPHWMDWRICKWVTEMDHQFFEGRSNSDAKGEQAVLGCNDLRLLGEV
ncbi:MAG: alpha/beta fold hydrolase [Planctomycetota bacterium]